MLKQNKKPEILLSEKALNLYIQPSKLEKSQCFYLEVSEFIH